MFISFVWLARVSSVSVVSCFIVRCLLCPKYNPKQDVGMFLAGHMASGGFGNREHFDHDVSAWLKIENLRRIVRSEGLLFSLCWLRPLSNGSDDSND